MTSTWPGKTQKALRASIARRRNPYRPGRGISATALYSEGEFRARQDHLAVQSLRELGQGDCLGQRSSGELFASLKKKLHLWETIHPPKHTNKLTLLGS